MYGSTDWREKKYAETYEQELTGLERRCQSDPHCTIGELEATLQHMYAMEGADWAGRGDLQDTILSASIAAWESFIASRKARETAGVR